jgi:hypothetical protein
MQRLFSMFPAGPVGVALVALRVSSAAALLYYGQMCSPLLINPWTWLLLGPTAAALLLGILTPVAAAIACLVEIVQVAVFQTQGTASVCLSFLNAAALGVLGPGAYSLDARIFGRRILDLGS